MAGPSILRAMRRLADPAVRRVPRARRRRPRERREPAAGRPAVPRPRRRTGGLRLRRRLGPEAEQTAEQIIDAIEAQTKAEVVVYTQTPGRDEVTTDEAEADAQALMDQWGVGPARHRRRPGHPLRPRHAPASTARCSSTPAPASTRRTSRRTSGRRSSTTRCCRRCRPATSTARPSRASAKIAEGDAGADAARRPGDRQADRRERAAARSAVPGPGDRPGGLRLRRALLARRDRRRPSRSSTASRRGPAPRSWSTASRWATRRATDGDRGARPRAHGPVARRAARASTTAW